MDNRDIRYLSSCEFYAPSAKSTLIASLNTPRAEAAAATDGQHVYVFGGLTTDGKDLDSAEQYDATGDKWTMVQATMSVARRELAAVCSSGRIYLIGGSARWGVISSRLVESFDPAEQRFSKVEQLPLQRWGHGAVSVRMSAGALAKLYVSQSGAYSMDFSSDFSIIKTRKRKHSTAFKLDL